MRTKTITVLFLGVFFFSACSKNPNPKVSGDVIPDNAMSFEYDETMHKAIVLEGFINDSIPTRFIFDTGGPGGILVSDSLKKELGQNAKVKIGQYEAEMTVSSNDKKFSMVKRYLGNKGAVITWRIFENKIIKISFENKYIQILDNLKDEIGYDSIRLKRHPDLPFMIIPINIYLQGKIIPLDLLFDTGANVYASNIEPGLASPYSLNMDSALYDKEDNPFKRGFRIKADSIGFGKYNVPTRKVGVAFYPGFENDPYASGLLGTLFMENYELIIDTKNYILYIKPRKNPVVDKLGLSFFK